MGIDFDELWHMPTKDRKYYIQKHNAEVDEENSKYRDKGSSTNEISAYTTLEQQNLKNGTNR